VDREIRAQLERAERAGFHPTHLDSHMGTLFASAAFLEKYIQLGIDKQIPVMLPGGHDSYIQADLDSGAIARLKKEGKYTPAAVLPSDARIQQMRLLGERLWRSGLPVLDDLHNTSYGWKPPDNDPTDDALRKWRTERYVETLKELKPGVTMVIMHCTAPTATFPHISNSGNLRKADMLAMLDPSLQSFLKEQGFIVSTWKELQERRKNIQ
jgi:hypothetical protein